jgi:hypothetical protein
MPAGSPSVPGGLARENLLMRIEMESSGADSTVSFKSCIFDPFLNQGVIGGDSSFIGFMADFRQGKVIQSATLPSTVIPGGNITSLKIDEIDNSIIAIISGQAAKSADAGASWTAIASTFAAFATNTIDIIAWRGAQLIAGTTKQTIPPRNYAVSVDNGLSWLSQHFSGMSGGASPLKIRKSANDAEIYFVGQSARLDISSSADLTAAAWTSFDFVTLFAAGTNGVDVAFNVGGDKAIYITDLGNVITSIDRGASWSSFPTALNYFKQGPAGFLTLDWIVFVPEFAGFLLGNATQAAFIPEDGALDTMTVVNIATNTAVGVITDACAMTDGNDAFMPASSNAGLLSPRPAT